MYVSQLLPIFRTMLETAVIVRAQYIMARAYGDIQGMREALETAILLDEDTVSVLEDAEFSPVDLSGKVSIPDTPEETTEVMRTIKQLGKTNLTSLLKTIPGELLDLEDHRQRAAKRRMVAVGNELRMLKRVMKERWDAWTPALEREFAPMTMRLYPVLNLGQATPTDLVVAIDRLSGEWLGKFGVVSIGDAFKYGQWVIEIRTKGDPGALAWALPTEFMGYPVEVLPGGEIRLQ